MQNDDYSNQITENLFLGGLWATSPAELSKNRIECVLNVSAPETDGNRGQHELLDRLVLPISDSWDESEKMFSDVLPKSIEFLQKHSIHRVLVHCSAGASRSATVVIGWIMLKHNLSREAATAYVFAKRPKIKPNHGFVMALDRWEAQLKKA